MEHQRSDAPAVVRLAYTHAGICVGARASTPQRQMADAALVRRPALKVLCITGYAENAALNDGHLKPGMQVMTKPFAMEALAKRVGQIIRG